MTKQLREWTAPDGRVWRWNDDWSAWLHQSPLGWHSLTAAEYADLPPEYRDKLDALRADPIVRPKGLREQLRDSFWQHRGVDDWADAVMALIDRERPALGEVDAEMLVGELVRRGYESREMAYSSLGAVMHSGSKTEDPRKVYGLNCGSVRRVLIAPERAG